MFCGLHNGDVRRITFRVGPARRSIQGVSINADMIPGVSISHQTALSTSIRRLPTPSVRADYSS